MGLEGKKTDLGITPKLQVLEQEEEEDFRGKQLPWIYFKLFLLCKNVELVVCEIVTHILFPEEEVEKMHKFTQMPGHENSAPQFKIFSPFLQKALHQKPFFVRQETLGAEGQKKIYVISHHPSCERREKFGLRPCPSCGFFMLQNALASLAFARFVQKKEKKKT